jgi:hypothetical protein
MVCLLQPYPLPKSFYQESFYFFQINTTFQPSQRQNITLGFVKQIIGLPPNPIKIARIGLQQTYI